jgi:hypothetical protein
MLEPVHDTKPPIVTIAEAAKIAGKSTSWVRSYRSCGPLEPGEVDGRHGVSLQSLLAFLRFRDARRPPKAPPHLRLVIDNTK